MIFKGFRVVRDGNRMQARSLFEISRTIFI